VSHGGCSQTFLLVGVELIEYKEDMKPVFQNSGHMITVNGSLVYP